MGLRFGKSSAGAKPSYSDLIAFRESPESERPLYVHRPKASRGRLIALAAGAVVAGLVLLLAIGFFVMPSSQEQQQRPLAQVTATKLNCRAAPAPDAAVIAVALRTQRVELQERNGAWQRIGLGRQACWVSGEFVEPIKPGT